MYFGTADKYIFLIYSEQFENVPKKLVRDFCPKGYLINLERPKSIKTCLLKVGLKAMLEILISPWMKLMEWIILRFLLISYFTLF